MWIVGLCISIMVAAYIIGLVFGVNNYKLKNERRQGLPGLLQIPFDAFMIMCFLGGPVAIVTFFVLVSIFG
ncbi:hypothetical protein D3C76_1780260 [compost metagenome]